MRKSPFGDDGPRSRSGTSWGLVSEERHGRTHFVPLLAPEDSVGLPGLELHLGRCTVAFGMEQRQTG